MGRSPVALLSLTTAAVLAAGGCSASNADTDAASDPTSIPTAFTKPPSTAAVSNCGPDSGATIRPGTLTIATDSPAYEPWFVGDDPSNGKGFEGAVAKAVYQKLGYRPDEVQFVRVPWTEAIKPGPKTFDFDINQVTIVGDRRDAVDFSSPYYAVAQSIIAMSGTRAASAHNLNDLTSYRLGAQAGTTSLAAITGTIRPAIAPTTFATNDEAKAALAAGTIDALVVDIPTGLQITKSDLPNSVLVGQFPRPNTVTEFFGLVLEKNSKLTSCASAALDGLYADGTLDQLSQTWLIDSARVPILE
ncbi:amino acid ABC transporter substrate-binding protein [Rhodococcus spelaei]|uniref:Amino acid ABC transporter substrate-binding protein n=1 Tax=Rhodococcus spelaei TaxID=2546320 RepID=A0A541BQ05_9NOCA|nr:transporter substrate-binding domain-containing protein [Rhodococcus spelaei]TQF74355.1 amino acid ABC transporter substrate-binding protein [Rhodococcus spelaei]